MCGQQYCSFTCSCRDKRFISFCFSLPQPSHRLISGFLSLFPTLLIAMARGIRYSGCLLSCRLNTHLLDLIPVNLIEKHNEVVTVNVSSENVFFRTQISYFFAKGPKVKNCYLKMIEFISTGSTGHSFDGSSIHPICKNYHLISLSTLLLLITWIDMATNLDWRWRPDLPTVGQ